MKTWNPTTHPGHGVAVLTVDEIYSGADQIFSSKLDSCHDESELPEEDLSNVSGGRYFYKRRKPEADKK